MFVVTDEEIRVGENARNNDDSGLQGSRNNDASDTDSRSVRDVSPNAPLISSGEVLPAQNEVQIQLEHNTPALPRITMEPDEERHMRLLRRIEQREREKKERRKHIWKLFNGPIAYIVTITLTYAILVLLFFFVSFTDKETPIGNDARLIVGSEWVRNYIPEPVNFSTTESFPSKSENERLVFEKYVKKSGIVPVDIISTDDVAKGNPIAEISPMPPGKRYSLEDYPLGPNPPVPLDNDTIAFRRSYNITALNNQMQFWFAIACHPELRHRGRRHFRKQDDHHRKLGVEAWSLNCTDAFPRGFDIAIILKVPLPQANLFDLISWGAIEESAGSYVAREVFNATEGKVLLLPARNNGVQSLLSAFPVRKTCDKLFDDCQSNALVSYSNSYKMMNFKKILVSWSNTTSELVNGARIVTFKSGDAGLWALQISHDLYPETVAEVELTFIVRPSSFRRSSFYALAYSILAMIGGVVFLILIKLVGITVRFASRTRFAHGTRIIDITTTDVLDGAYEDVRRVYLLQVFNTRNRLNNCFSSVKKAWQNAQSRCRELLYSSQAYRRVAVMHDQDDGAPCGREEDPNCGTTSLKVESLSDGESDKAEVCKICCMQEPLSDLVAPCTCCGTGKYVHKTCLNKWRRMTSNPEHRDFCSVCKSAYTIPLNSTDDTVSVWTRIVRFFRLFAFRIVLLAVIPALATGSGYLIKAVAYVLTLDHFICWNITVAHLVCGCSVLMCIALSFKTCLFCVQDFPSNATERIPLLILIGIVLPLVWGSAYGALTAPMFSSLLTPEVRFLSGTCITLCVMWLLDGLFLWVETWPGVAALFKPHRRVTRERRSNIAHRRMARLNAQAEERRQQRQNASTESESQRAENAVYASSEAEVDREANEQNHQEEQSDTHGTHDEQPEEHNISDHPQSTTQSSVSSSIPPVIIPVPQINNGEADAAERNFC